MYSSVYFDLKTTGLGMWLLTPFSFSLFLSRTNLFSFIVFVVGIADINQISAVCKENSFSMYVKLEVPITAKTSKITGLTFDVLSWKACCLPFPAACLGELSKAVGIL